MTGEGEKVSCVRIANDPVALSLAVADGRRGRRGGDRGDLWLVLGGGPAPGGWPPGASRASVGQRLGQPAGQERRARRPGPGGSVAAGSAGGGVDRAAGDAGAAGVGALSSQGGRVALGPEGTGTRGDGQRGRVAGGTRHVRARRQRPTRCARARACVLEPHRVASRSDRALRPRGGDVRASHPPAAARPHRVSGDPGPHRRGPHHRGHLRRRDR